MATISIFDIFKIGIGPSSSHTVGPMNAARAFMESLGDVATEVGTIEVSLHGSLAWTGKGHGTDSAVMLGLSGFRPETIDPDSVDDRLRDIHANKRLEVPGIGELAFDPAKHLSFDFEQELPRHTNGMRFIARSNSGELLAEDLYYSLGGGFIAKNDEPEVVTQVGEPPLPYNSSESLLQCAADNGLTIAELIYRNEMSWRSADEIESRIESLCQAMRDCVARGLRTDGVLPGKLSVLRRAPKMMRKLSEQGEHSPVHAMGWVNAYAIAVNEENAAGGRVVTSPTNGAAGIIPAVLMYYENFITDADHEGRETIFTNGRCDRCAVQEQCVDLRGRDGLSG